LPRVARRGRGRCQRRFRGDARLGLPEPPRVPPGGGGGGRSRGSIPAAARVVCRREAGSCQTAFRFLLAGGGGNIIIIITTKKKKVKIKISSAFPPSSFHYPHFKCFCAAKGGAWTGDPWEAAVRPRKGPFEAAPRWEPPHPPHRGLRARAGRSAVSSDITTPVTPHAPLFAAGTVVKPTYK